MNKKQLVAKIATACNMGKSDAEKTFDKIQDIILSELKNDETVKIAGFGTYKVAKRKARTGRNPRTGEKVNISNRKSIKFKMSKELKSRINSGISEEEVNKKIELMYDNKKK